MSLPRVHTLPNGVRVICDPIPSLQTLALSVVAGRGARFEDEARSGWSHLLEHMVFKGAGERSARDIVEVIEAEGGHINAATGYARTSYQVRALAGGLDLGMAVISDLLLRPTLSAEELEREKHVIAQEIAEAADTPDDLVFDLAQEAAYPDQPLGRPILGTVESIGRADPETLAAWRAQLYGAESLVIAASGAVDEGELLASAERWFGDATPAPQPAVAPDAVFAGGVKTLAKRLEQAHLVFQLPSVGAKHPDYFALRLFAEHLGRPAQVRLRPERHLGAAASRQNSSPQAVLRDDRMGRLPRREPDPARIAISLAHGRRMGDRAPARRRGLPTADHLVCTFSTRNRASGARDSGPRRLGQPDGARHGTHR